MTAAIAETVSQTANRQSLGFLQKQKYFLIEAIAETVSQTANRQSLGFLQKQKYFLTEAIAEKVSQTAHCHEVKTVCEKENNNCT